MHFIPNFMEIIAINYIKFNIHLIRLIRIILKIILHILYFFFIQFFLIKQVII